LGCGTGIRPPVLANSPVGYPTGLSFIGELKMGQRVLVLGEKMVHEKGTMFMQLFIPEWDANERPLVPMTTVPQEVLQSRRFPDNKLRFTANVDVGEDELRLRDLENLEIRGLFERDDDE
jgi:hypothetical protein